MTSHDARHSPDRASTAESGGSAAPYDDLFDLPPREGFLRLSDHVLVLASEVAAVTQHSRHPDQTAVYLRGSGGHSAVLVARPLAEVAQLLEAARSSNDPPF